MTDEQRFFIQTLSDHLNGRKTEARPGLDWDALLACANSHQVSGILYQQCSAFLPANASAVLQKRCATELFYYHNREALFGQIAEALSEAKIPFFSVKGLEVARFYPVPALRTMGDCDIVVHPEDQERANAVMCALGFTLCKKDSAESVYEKNDLEIELHSHLLYEEAANTAAERVFFDAAWDYAKPAGDGMRFELAWSFHFLFLLFHLKKHLINSGVGFRQFMDLAVVIRCCELDWPWLEAQLDGLGLKDFARVCFALLNRWFGVDAPFALPELTETFCDEAAEKIFAGGVFGYDDEANRDNARMQSINSGNRRLSARIRYLLSVCFLPYDAMRVVPAYAFLDGRPWLLPAAWVYRLFYKLGKKRGEAGMRMVKTAFVSDEALDARQRELAKWGL